MIGKRWLCKDLEGAHQARNTAWATGLGRQEDQCYIGNCAGGLVTQLCPTLCDTMDCSLPGSSVHGIL